jgi:hypothetical protein
MYSQLLSGDGGLELAAGDRLLRFPAVWLRDNCPCAGCVDPARTAFSVTGHRHLQGCYADLDGLASTLAVLRREERP